jgi:hypothetical protein
MLHAAALRRAITCTLPFRQAGMLRGLMRRTAGAVVLLAISQPLCAADAPTRPLVRDTAYGETLYAFYQKQYFPAISRLLVARERGELRQQAGDGELLLGGLYVQYGLPDAATSIFNNLAPADAAQAARVWLALAELNYRRGRFPEALAIIEQRFARDTAPEDAVLLAVKSLMRLGRYTEAIAWLGNEVSQRPEARYLRFNIAVAQIAADDNETGAQTLEALLLLPAGDDELLALRDRVALALAATRLKQQRPAQAVAALRSTRLGGPYSSEALLVYGIASLRNVELAQAATALNTLTRRATHEQAVQEGWIALAQVYEARDDSRRTLATYRAALKHLQGELQYLSGQAAAIESGEWFAALERRAGAIALRDDRAGVNDSDVIGVPLHYRQFAGNRFVLTFTQYVEVSLLARMATDWQDRVPVLSYLVESREQRHRRLVSEAQTLLTNTPLTPLQLRQTALTQRANAGIAGDDPAVLANQKRQRLLNMITQMEERMTRWPERDWTRQRERVALLKGVLQWEIAREQPEQAWKFRRAVRENGRLLNEGMDLRKRVGAAMKVQQSSVEGWLPSLARDAEALKQLAERSQALRAKLRARMEDDARETIRSHRERIVDLAGEAYYGLAQAEHARVNEQREARRQSRKPAEQDQGTLEGGTKSSE